MTVFLTSALKNKKRYAFIYDKNKRLYIIDQKNTWIIITIITRVSTPETYRKSTHGTQFRENEPDVLWEKL